MAELDEAQVAELEVRTGSDATGATVVTVAGDLDMSNVETLRETVASITATPPPRLVFDLSGLRFIDSAGISVLLGAIANVEQVQLRDPSPAVRRVVELTGLTQVLELEP